MKRVTLKTLETVVERNVVRREDDRRAMWLMSGDGRKEDGGNVSHGAGVDGFRCT